MGVIVKTVVSAPVEDAVSLELGSDMGDLFDKLQSVKTARKALDDMEKSLRATLMTALPPRDARRTVLTVDGIVRASLVQSERNSTDAKMLAADFPDVYAATLKTSPVETLKMV